MIDPPVSTRLISTSREFKHILSHRILYAKYFLLETKRGPDQYIKVSNMDLKDLPVSRLMEIMMDDINITFYAKKD